LAGVLRIRRVLVKLLDDAKAQWFRDRAIASGWPKQGEPGVIEALRCARAF